MNRCKWCINAKENMIQYHDNEWGTLVTNDKYLFEMLLLESFQAGLSWECILDKRENLRNAYDDFNVDKIIKYDDVKKNELVNNSLIIRNKLKIKASVNNALIFKDIVNQYGSFYNYLKIFTKDKVIFETDKVSSKLSDKISEDLYQKGMRFVGTVIIYSYLQAIGIINSHDKDCFKYKKCDL